MCSFMEVVLVWELVICSGGGVDERYSRRLAGDVVNPKETSWPETWAWLSDLDLENTN